MILVVGSGFGLYGHAAALAAAGHEVAMPSRYRTLATDRPELAHLSDTIEWIADEHAAAARAELICMARRPADNVAFVERILRGGLGAILVLEKPMAPTWQEAMSLEATLSAANRRWYTPYLFLYCDWFALIADRLARGISVEVRWRHRQSPNVRRWKLVDAEGGSAISFYFIHCLALLEALLPGCSANYTVTRIEDEVKRVEFVASDAAAQLHMAFMLDETYGFDIRAGGRTIFEASTPFGAAPQPGQPDPRIPALRYFYRSMFDADDRRDDVGFQAAVTRRWRDLHNA